MLTPVVACDDECNPYVGPHSTVTGEPSCQPQCPDKLRQGEACEWENQRCLFSTGKCAEIVEKRTVCTCAVETVGLRWACAIRQCSCTCPCGVSLIQSCDSVDCAEPEDECPATVKASCDHHCAEGDGGPRPDGSSPDGGVVPDVGPTPDSTVDASVSDTTVDLPPPDTAVPDTTVDLPVPDAGGDGPADAASGVD